MFIKKIIIGFIATCIPSICMAKGQETSGGAVISLYQADYGKFADYTAAEGQPKFNNYLFLVGGDVTLKKKNFFTGGRVLYGRVSSVTDTTSASGYQIANIGIKAGYGFDTILDFKIGMLFGLGKLSYTINSTATNASIFSDYIFLEPFVMFGLFGTKNFLASFGAGYHYAIPYKTETYGTTLITEPSTDVTIGGVNIMFQLSFGDFGR